MTTPQECPPVVPDHHLLRRIGRGGYGEVWLARSVLGTYRAVKFVFKASFDNLRPYEREFSGLQKFEPISRSHPGLVSILHVGRNEEAGYFYCVMELADDVNQGPSLVAEKYRPRTVAEELARRGRLSLAECLEVGEAIASALSFLHASGLIHRDLKPSNIIFSGGLPKLADVGLVASIGNQASFVGTAGYLAPEGPGSPLADIYSLGRVLYEISMGKEQEHFPELPTRLRELSDAPELIRLNQVVLKACEAQPMNRFQSADEFRSALTALRTGDLDSKKTNQGRREMLGPSTVLILPLAKEPAQSDFADPLRDRLREAGYHVIIDDFSEFGLEWARRLETLVHSAIGVVVLLGAIQDEFGAYSLETVRQATTGPMKKTSGLTVVFNLPQGLPEAVAMCVQGTHIIHAKEASKDLVHQVVKDLQRLTSSSLKKDHSNPER